MQRWPASRDRKAPPSLSINATLDGCCDHQAIPAKEESHRHIVANLNRADALSFGRVTYETMEGAFPPSAQKTEALPEWMQPFARTIDAAKTHVVSSTLNRVEWNAKLIHAVAFAALGLQHKAISNT